MTKISSQHNHAFVDGQNLYMATTKRPVNSWEVDLKRFRVYLEKKYQVSKAYYFLGYVQNKNQGLYEEIQSSGFVLTFREHNPAMMGTKKGNVDSDIVFHVMKKVYKKENFDKIVLVSGDGDYKLLVDFLIEEDKLKKVLFPDQKRASSLYKTIDLKYRADLSEQGVRNKVQKKKRAP